VGIDNDGDGRINEDGRGGYDMNRNWGHDWQPAYIQYGAKDYPFSQPETRAVAHFVLAHPNIAAAQCYHNSGGMFLRGPGREGGDMQDADERILKLIAEQGERILPYYRSLVSWRDLYTTWGDEDSWFYGGQGVLGFTNEMWTSRNLYRTARAPTDEEEIEFLRHVLLDEGIVPWAPYNHPTYGQIEIGGYEKEWGRMPPSFLLEEELHRNMAFTLYHASTMPQIHIRDVEIEPLGGRLHRIWVSVENRRLIPTRTAQDVDKRISPPDVISLAGDGIRVVSGGRVRDRFFRKVEAVEARPERLLIDTIGGMDAVHVQFIVQGEGAFTITVDSAKGGLLRTTRSLPTP
jgi:hypothetical protein